MLKRRCELYNPFTECYNTTPIKDHHLCSASGRNASGLK
jgi:hypothetical protein